MELELAQSEVDRDTSFVNTCTHIIAGDKERQVIDFVGERGFPSSMNQGPILLPPIAVGRVGEHGQMAGLPESMARTSARELRTNKKKYPTSPEEMRENQNGVTGPLWCS